MGSISITQGINGEKVNSQDSEWEKVCYQKGCQLARQEAIQRLKEIDDWLFKQHSLIWEDKGFKERTLVTRFGELTISRRLYLDEDGGHHFLLDEYLGWMPKQVATPNLQESLVTLATQVPFRQVSGTLENLTAGVLSASTIYRLVQKTAHSAIENEKEDWQDLFERGELPSSDGRRVFILFSEEDGTFIHLQREEQKQYEIKQSIAYEGWERLSGKEERYRLLNKRVYCHANEGIPFWEGVSLEWSRKWDLGYLKEIVIGGDGANWIDSGIAEFARAIRQLDGFHLARACGRGWQEGNAIYEAIRAGEIEKARSLINNLVPREGVGVQQSRRYVKRNLDKGKDWRTCSQHPIGAESQMEGRGLGTMESNEDKLVANRMKKRGLSWTIEGALRMNKALQLAAKLKPR